MADDEVMVARVTFHEELRALINKHSRENMSDTPDFILAEYVMESLVAIEAAVQRRDAWNQSKSRERVITADLLETLERILAHTETVYEGEMFVKEIARVAIARAKKTDA